MSDLSAAVQRSLSVFPAGSNGEFNLPPELSLVIAEGRGCKLQDTEGNAYLDFSMGWGSSLVGHAHPDIVAAVTEQARRGSNFAYVTETSLALAEEIRGLSPACRRIRFCASGTEATMYCQRIARAYTGRPRILKFEGAYHGANEVGVTSLFPRHSFAFPRPEPSSAGIPQAMLDQVLVAPYNDSDTVGRIVSEYRRELAAVIVEPLQRCIPPRPEFLRTLREICSQNDVILIFDEVVTGFRLAYGGAQEYYGVNPDLVAYGKALGGGYPIGAFGGAEKFMDIVRENRIGERDYVWVASTLGGNPVSAAAALAALSVFRRPDTYRRLHEMGAYLRAGITGILADQNLCGQAIGDGPLAQVVFSDQPVFDYRSTRRGDGQRSRTLMLELFSRGIFLNPMGTKLYLSIAHTSDECDRFLECFESALIAMIR